MTATPIPRTLALTTHGDMALSAIDELPPGRQPVLTHAAQDTPTNRAKVSLHAMVSKLLFIVSGHGNGPGEECSVISAVQSSLQQMVVKNHDCA